MHPDKLKKIIIGFFGDTLGKVLVHAAHFSVVCPYVQHSHERAFFIHNGKGEELVHGEKFAGIKDGGEGRNGDWAPDHQIINKFFRLAEKKRTGGHYTLQFPIRIHHIKVDDPRGKRG